MAKTIIILGGYGNAGAIIVRLLVPHTDARIILAGRDVAKARRAADALNSAFSTDRMSGACIDASDRNSLVSAFKDVSLVVVASGTIEHTPAVAGAALDAGIDYFDVQISSKAKHAALESLRERIQSSGRCFITDGGFRPGIPGAMVRSAATHFTRLEAATVGSAFQVNWNDRDFSPSTAEEFVDELQSYSMLVLKNGAWVQGKMSEVPQLDLGEPFGKRYCTPMFMEEFRSLPEAIPSLRETGFYSAGFGWKVDYLIIPVALALVKLFPERSRALIGRIFTYGLKHWTTPPYGAVLRMDARGVKGEGAASMRMIVAHTDAYALTAISAAACIMQYCSGAIGRPGLWFQAGIVEPVQFFRDLEHLGVQVQCTWDNAEAGR